MSSLFLRFAVMGSFVLGVLAASVLLGTSSAQAYPYDVSHSYNVRASSVTGTNISTGDGFDYPVSVHIADFDGDGDKDVATAGYQIWDIFISLNNGDGTFTRGGAYPVDGTPLVMTSADIDGDGDQDIATGNNASNTVSILFNLGDGSFSTSTQYAVSDYPRGVSFADIDGDGDQDLGVGRAGGSSVLIFLNDGEGVFTQDATYASGAAPSDLVFADLDGDTDMDMGVANLNANTVSVFLNDGDGNYATGTSYASGGASPIKVVAADVDGDEDIDLVAVNSTGGSLAVFKNNGNGTFAAVAVILTDIVSGVDLVAGDLDGDGDPDLTTVTASTNSLHTFFNDGTGAFGGGERYQGGRSTNSVDMGDLDGDGDTDLAIANGLSDSIAILLNKGGGRFPQPATYVVGSEYQYNILSADVDNDGYMDVLVSLAKTGYPIAVLKNNGDGTLAAPVDYLTSPGASPYLFRTADVNSDGYQDIGVVLTYATSQSGFGIMMNNGDGTFAETVIYATGYIPTTYFGLMALEFADFDHDGDQDLMANERETGEVHVFLNNGEGVFTHGEAYGVGTAPHMLALADYNGDGEVDAAVSNILGMTVSLLFGNGDGTFQDAITYSDGMTTYVGDIDAGDLDGDGDVDIIVVGGTLEDAVSVLLNNGDGTFASPLVLPTDIGPQNIILSDLDYDDDLDIAVTMYTFNSVGVIINNGDGTFQNIDSFLTGKEGKGRPGDIDAVDLDNDGVMELIIENVQAPTMSVIHSLLPPPPPEPEPTPTQTNSGGGGLGSSGSHALPPLVQFFQQVFSGGLLPNGIPTHGLIKIPSSSAVYYVGSDGKRHAFPNDKVYFTWYENFDGVQLVSETQLSSISLGTNITYKPGKKMVKFTTDNKVYVVAKGGMLRWVTTEEAAVALYGSSWNTQIDDISDAFYTNYTFGQDVTGLSDFNPTTVQASVQFPSDSLQM